MKLFLGKTIYHKDNKLGLYGMTKATNPNELNNSNYAIVFNSWDPNVPIMYVVEKIGIVETDDENKPIGEVFQYVKVEDLVYKCFLE